MGDLLFLLLTGVAPFAAVETQTLQGLLLAKSGEAPSPRALRPELAAPADALVRRLLAPDPKDRPTSAAEVRETLIRTRERLR